MDGSYTESEVNDLLALMAKWQDLENDRWKLISFDENKARYGWLDRGSLQYTKYVSVNRVEINFFRGIEPDALARF